jgi:predicted oxidoreductase (fatty acid repression mutant protein)
MPEPLSGELISMSDLSAAFAQVVEGRRSLRAFKPEAVSEELLTQVFQVAQRAPSNCNTQPWLVHVASGASIEKLTAHTMACTRKDNMDQRRHCMTQ